ncbi:hypothetical protein AB835_07860 [Candidatus Endobugula sertula]|uniref:Uncharacterized protein n=1 Tax=Candidatus Endobugula sertula TaxID=62101 RepID=A0A1D2QQ02_9GAMM|nr:hypothetical protein AB835_07860 [Candidatus Endobugula sertula]
MINRILLTFFILSYSAWGLAIPKDVVEELDTYISIFKSGFPSEQIAVAKKLEWSGLSDPKLFDLIEKKIA